MRKHLLPEELLRCLDGELRRFAMRRATAHLQSCRSCQVELERLKEHIAAILDAENAVFEPCLPPPAPWPRLGPRLERAGRSEPPLWNRCARRAVRFILRSNS